MKHELRWNPELEEWFCMRCGCTSDRIVCEEAQAEMESFECELGSKASARDDNTQKGRTDRPA